MKFPYHIKKEESAYEKRTCCNVSVVFTFDRKPVGL